MVALTPEGQLQDIIFTPTASILARSSRSSRSSPSTFYMFNSFVIALASTVVVLVIASLAGYAFGRLEFPGRTPLMLLVLVISFFPPAAFFIPLNDLFNTSFFFLEPITGDGTLYNTPFALDAAVGDLHAAGNLHPHDVLLADSRQALRTRPASRERLGWARCSASSSRCRHPASRPPAC